jgi:hypothetical protein
MPHYVAISRRTVGGPACSGCSGEQQAQPIHDCLYEYQEQSLPIARHQSIANMRMRSRECRSPRRQQTGFLNVAPSTQKSHLAIIVESQASQVENVDAIVTYVRG